MLPLRQTLPIHEGTTWPTRVWVLVFVEDRPLPLYMKYLCATPSCEDLPSPSSARHRSGPLSEGGVKGGVVPTGP